MSYKLSVTAITNGWKYSIFLEKDGNQILVGEGYRPDEHTARIDGVEDLKLARSFRVGMYG